MPDSPARSTTLPSPESARFTAASSAASSCSRPTKTLLDTGPAIHPLSSGSLPPVNRVETRLEGPILLQPAVHGDARGFFVETYRKNEYAQAGVVEDFVQDNHSRSARGVVRGIHFHLPPRHAKP